MISIDFDGKTLATIAARKRGFLNSLAPLPPSWSHPRSGGSHELDQAISQA